MCNDTKRNSNFTSSYTVTTAGDKNHLIKLNKISQIDSEEDFIGNVIKLFRLIVYKCGANDHNTKQCHLLRVSTRNVFVEHIVICFVICVLYFAISETIKLFV